MPDHAGAPEVSAEKLPKGFARRPSGSLRVQVRVDGHVERRHFALAADTAEERRRQFAEAEAWAGEVRRKIVGRSHVSHREAERTTLLSVLQTYEREGLVGDPANAAKDRTRIRVLLKDPISRKTLAQLRRTDIAALRDRLLHAGWLKRVENAARAAEAGAKGKAARARCTEIRSLPDLLARSKAGGSDDERGELEAKVALIVRREGIKPLARTTVANTVQLVTRALKHAAQTIDGVPDLTGVPMPKGSPGRERRPSHEELATLLRLADERMAVIIRLAIATTLRRERLLTCRTSHVRKIGGGKSTLAFPRDASKRKKRTGIVPVTKEIRELLDVALRISHPGPAPIRADAPFFELTMHAFESQWRRLLIAAGIEDLHFHDLRHEGTSRLFEKGLTTAEVMSVTGHSTKEMVDRYSHYSASLVLEKLERGTDKAALLSEIGFLIAQLRAAGGDMQQVRQLM